MTAKPTTRDGYSNDQLDVVTRTCLYVFAKLGDLCDEVVVVGGLVPYLLVDQDDPPMLLGPTPGRWTSTWGWRWQSWADSGIRT